MDRDAQSSSESRNLTHIYGPNELPLGAIFVISFCITVGCWNFQKDLAHSSGAMVSVVAAQGIPVGSPDGQWRLILWVL